MDANRRLAAAFEDQDARISALEQAVRSDEVPSLDIVLGQGREIMAGLLRAYADHAGKSVPETDDLLAIFKAFVKGDPSLNAVRDNVRELVFYTNCLDMAREDALPKHPERMAVHTLRHVYLYLHSRSEQEHRL
jgi:hypothetical protein